ncbi:hypothetical protein INS49_011423 [Diaporthe citri]|uniref:uncharacterized protein n=1 Tax=Diaporthe citri TaxID=83186 RepID=UPI001C8133A8|nr:uncharacterized protein INS49_011423 [Diaporthe citri]KAG6360365.1 hypothetical protein INS49_011423 [Diaporthe citri]
MDRQLGHGPRGLMAKKHARIVLEKLVDNSTPRRQFVSRIVRILVEDNKLSVDADATSALDVTLEDLACCTTTLSDRLLQIGLHCMLGTPIPTRPDISMVHSAMWNQWVGSSKAGVSEDDAELAQRIAWYFRPFEIGEATGVGARKHRKANGNNQTCRPRRTVVIYHSSHKSHVLVICSILDGICDVFLYGSGMQRQDIKNALVEAKACISHLLTIVFSKTAGKHTWWNKDKSKPDAFPFRIHQYLDDPNDLQDPEVHCFDVAKFQILDIATRVVEDSLAVDEIVETENPISVPGIALSAAGDQSGIFPGLSLLSDGIPDYPDEEIERRVIAANIAQRFLVKLTDDDFHSLLEAAGPDPGPLVASEAARQCIDRFRHWYKQLIDITAMVAVSYDKAPKWELGTMCWAFRFANASSASRKRLHTFYCDPRITPLHIQCAFGQKIWTPAILDSLPHLDVASECAIPNAIGHYMLAVRGPGNPGPEDPVHLYHGSATSLDPTVCGNIGYRSRLPHHEQAIDVARASTARPPLFCQWYAALPGHTHAFYEFARILKSPKNHPPALLTKARLLTLNSEDLGTIFLDTCRVPQQPSEAQRTEFFYYAQASLRLSQITRPQGLPRAPFRGLNLVLPSTQQWITFWSPKKPCLPQVSTDVMASFESFYQKTGRRYVTQADIKDITRDHPELGRQDPKATYSDIRGAYETVLASHKVKYVYFIEQSLNRKLLVVCAVIKYCDEVTPSIVTLGEDGNYSIPEVTGIRWLEVAHIALDLAPSSISTDFVCPWNCQRLWVLITRDLCSNRLNYKLTNPFGTILQKPFWDSLRG